MNHNIGVRERFVQEQSVIYRELFKQFPQGSGYNPNEATQEELCELAELYRRNLNQIALGEWMMEHFSSYRSANMIQPRDSHMFLWPQIHYLPTIPHVHEYFELGILLKGKCRHFVRDTSISMTEGDVIMIPPGTEHQPVMLTDSCVWYDLGICVDQLSAVLPHLWNEKNPLIEFMHSTHRIVSDKAYAVLHADPEILQHIIGMADEIPKNSLLMRKDELIAELIVSQLAMDPEPLLVPNDLEALNPDEWIIRYIHGNFRTLTRKKLAEHFSYSERQITRIVQKQTGSSVQDYLQEVRFEYIVDMLKNTLVPIRDIVEAAGYHNNNNFFHLFRQRYGMTPGEYRKKRQEEL